MIEQKFLNFSNIQDLLENSEEDKMLWNGVKENSFGLVFGPSKSGKTIFCENLAISLAVGRNSYFDYSLDGTPQKILFIGLEEFWRSRATRNQRQFFGLSSEEQQLMKNNYLFQNLEFPKTITTDESWDLLAKTIEESEANVVFIDSITRMNHGKIEDSKTAEQITLKLRTITQELGITLFAIHHTPKLYDNPISMDRIKGSSVFSQESDFAIGINRTDKNFRYMKNVFFRYSDDNDETVKEFVINENILLETVDDVEESEILNRTDRRRADNKRDLICEFFNKNSDVTYSAGESVKVIYELTGLKERQIKGYLSDLSSAGRIANPNRGEYCSILNKKGGKFEA